LNIENQYTIAFKGLKEGTHDFIFNVGKPFIEHYEYLEARDGKLVVNVSMIKKTTYLSFSIGINGYIEVQCDRCLDYFQQEINFKGDFYVKFSETASEPEDDVIIMHPDEEKINLSQYIFESIGLSIPVRKIHPLDKNHESTCNKDMLSLLQKHLVSNEHKNKINDIFEGLI
jgi:uncharacterized metal-binding protein YceD (DUF177 family)